MRQSSGLLCTAPILFLLAASSGASATILYSNGSQITNPGAGFNGADVDQASADVNGSNTVSKSGSTIRKYTDDFVVPAAGWTITSATGYAWSSATYPSFPPTSPITAITAQLWSAAPSGASTGLIATSTTIIDNSWTGTYWIPNGTVNLSNNLAPIMAVTADFGSLFLNAGTYWVSFGFTALAPGGGTSASTGYIMSLDGSGNPVTNTGNGRAGLSTNNGSTYIWSAQQTARGGVEFPFLINGSVPAPGAAVLLGFAGLAAARRRR